MLERVLMWIVFLAGIALLAWLPAKDGQSHAVASPATQAAAPAVVVRVKQPQP